jgi:hypothetical protein
MPTSITVRARERSPISRARRLTGIDVGRAEWPPRPQSSDVPHLAWVKRRVIGWLRNWRSPTVLVNPPAVSTEPARCHETVTLGEVAKVTVAASSHPANGCSPHLQRSGNPRFWWCLVAEAGACQRASCRSR